MSQHASRAAGGAAPSPACWPSPLLAGGGPGHRRRRQRRPQGRTSRPQRRAGASGPREHVAGARPPASPSGLLVADPTGAATGWSPTGAIDQSQADAIQTRVESGLHRCHGGDLLGRARRGPDAAGQRRPRAASSCPTAGRELNAGRPALVVRPAGACMWMLHRDVAVSSIRPCRDDDRDAILGDRQRRRRGIPRRDPGRPLARAVHAARRARRARSPRAWRSGATATPLIGVMGIQPVRRRRADPPRLRRPGEPGPRRRRRAAGAPGATVPGPLLVGTWAAAEWAIRFYERHGFGRSRRAQGRAAAGLLGHPGAADRDLGRARRSRLEDRQRPNREIGRSADTAGTAAQHPADGEEIAGRRRVARSRCFPQVSEGEAIESGTER